MLIRSSMKPLVAIEVPLAIMAIACGLLLVLVPDGALLGMTPALLDGSPFRDFRIPGLALTFLVGGTTAVAGALAIARHRLAPWASWIAALALTTWLAVQVRDIPFHPMQVAIGAAAIAIVALAAHARWA
jgi:hypothetical protein